jgi:hypothetical protein
MNPAPPVTRHTRCEEVEDMTESHLSWGVSAVYLAIAAKFFLK